MILDSGILTVFRKSNTPDLGRMPAPSYTMLHMGWYGRLNFETSPVRPTEGRQEHQTDLRVRILQCLSIRQNDVAVLRQLSVMPDAQAGETVYRITRAYHGTDPDNGALISDLSLEVVEP